MRIRKSVLQENAAILKQPMMGFLQKGLATLLLLPVVLGCVAQIDSSQELLHQFDVYRKQVLQEKLFVHTDKSVYSVGEILWFKIYDVDAFFHMPLGVSSVAYVEILDKNNKPILQEKLALNKGDGDGSIFLPLTLNSGNYKLRAYTNWMKNSSPDYFFEKSVTIFNAQKIPDSDPPQKIIKYNIDFFPEGGDLVNNLRSKVAFRVSDQYGKGMDCQALLMNSNQDTIGSFRSFKFGMGSFSFTPKPHDSYKAVLTFPDGKQVEKELPLAHQRGYVMHLERKGAGQLEIMVQCASDSPPQPNQLVYLFIHTRESIKWVGSKAIQNGEAVFSVDSSSLGDGISHITVFNNNREPVCERLYFKYPQHGLQLAVNTNGAEFECRNKINLHISSTDPSGKPRQADMSLAVYRLDSLQTLDPENIDNYLWLTSDLRGKVESPDYYFKNRGSETEQAMDNLMLTHGWRRFDWEEILENRKPLFEYTPEYNGHIISGKITNTKTGLPGKSVDGFLSVPGTNTQFRSALSDEGGKIKFELRDFFGSQEIIVQTNSQQDSEYRVDVSSPFIEQYSTTPLPYFSMPDKNPQSLLYASVNTQAENVYVSNKLQQFMFPMVDTSAFYVDPDDRYLLDSYTRFTTLEEIIREYVLGVNISRNEGKFSLVVTDESNQQKFNGHPLVLIDGVPVFDVDKFINNYDPLKLYKLEVVKRKYFLGYKSFDGIVNFTTYKGDLAGYELDPNAIVLDYEGLQLQRKFYSPEYENEQQLASHLPDFRNLLYWSPDIKTDIEGKNETIFYTSDLPGKYAAVVQGLDPSGRTGSQVLLFDVKSKSK
jgi:hypothetical protein